MSKHDQNFYRDVILEHIAALRSYAPRDHDVFVSDDKTFDACLMRLMAIGEDLSNLREWLEQQPAEFEWHKIIGLRNRIAHGYWEVDRDVIWVLLTDGSLDTLETALRTWNKKN